LRVTRDHKLVEEWELVLVSQGLSPTVWESPDGLVLSVPEHEVKKAQAGLSAYESENPKKPLELAEPVESPNWLTGIVVAALLLLFFSVTTVLSPALPWFERGSANAQRILEGELWRTVTALTLHADSVHAVSNAVAAILFVSVVSGMLGVGLSSALVLLAGAIGNLANAFLQGPYHVAVGASTSIFGAVGLLAGIGLIRQRRSPGPRRRPWWLPVAAALALLAMLGTTGERVDIWAHLLGLVFGTILGSLTAVVAPRSPGPLFQAACGSAAAATLLYCWIIALR
jgi:rhomboid protease GluP